ncbi:alpha/beta hydrolase fold-domain-containing protein [Cladorrhinum samala]|uniref:Alpha/beta hydrolase fold-domain-containing protein n=1 Tax=Cladorrhinum samala TaxID=585594 RepID=A0AAV9HCI6_9PEZI|nr:alpha/beta hydrolase fold-domain-containing protein [Cladorrhinum samala]
MLSPITLDREYQAAIAPYAGYVPPVPSDARSLRTQNDAAISAVLSGFDAPESSVKETTIPYGSSQRLLHRFVPDSASGKKGCILYIHGGGLVSGSVPLFRKDIIRYAVETGLPFYAPAYRLAPEHPFPAALEDVYAALEYLRDHAQEEGIDPSKIAVMGVSAGGGIAAGVALMARDKGFQPSIRKLVLIYPMLDDRTNLGADHPLNEHLTWTMKKNEIGWGAYLSGQEATEYAAPARVKDVSGLPRTYIDIGGLDLFRDEAMAFAAKLVAANVETEFHLYPGVPHGWEWISAKAMVTKKAIQNRVWALADL